MFPRLRITPETTALMTVPFVVTTLLVGPVLGSGVSAVVAGAVLLGLFEYFNANDKLTGNRPKWLIYYFILTWFGVQVLFGLLHSGGSSPMLEIVKSLPFLGFIVLVSRFDHSDPSYLRRVIHATAPVAAFVTLAAAAVQVQIGFSRVEGTAGNAGPFAVLCLIQYSLCLVTAVETGGRARFLGLAGAMAAGICVALSGMRGLWPCLLVLPCMIAVLYRDVLRQFPGRAALAAALILLAVLAVGGSSMKQRIERLGSDIRTIQSGGAEITSLSQHLLIWKAGWSLVREAPLSGHGIGRTRQLMAARTAEIGNEELAFSHFHNAILNEGVRTGIIGVAALLAMFFAPLALALRHRRGAAGRHGLAVIFCVTIIYACSGTTGIMFGHDLMDAVWIAAIAYGSFMAFETGPPPASHQSIGEAPAGSGP